uniref:Uncharacterized protein n=2 Tax=Oryza rufipogon TaxID=4529 RepID=A0A0E0MVL2_ORYRU
MFTVLTQRGTQIGGGIIDIEKLARQLIMGSVMGSLALAYHDAREFRMETKRKAEHEVNLLRPPALLHWDGGDGEQPPPLDERRRIVQRWIEYEKRKGPRRFEYLPGEDGANDARPNVRIALYYYNCNHPGAEFDCVRSLSAHFASFREEPLFVVRRIEGLQEPVHHTTKRELSITEEPGRTETVQEAPLVQYRSSCAFCSDRHYEVLHPSEEEFVCGKEGQEVEPSGWFYWMMDIGGRLPDRILVRPRCFLDDVSDFCSFVFYVFFIWLARLASAIKVSSIG